MERPRFESGSEFASLAEAATSTLSLREASALLGVSSTTLKKAIRGGTVPEAEKERRPEGRVWRLPFDSLPDIAIRHQWSLSLDTADFETALLDDQRVGGSADEDADQFEVISVDDDGQVSVILEESQQPFVEQAVAPSAADISAPGVNDAPSMAEVLDLALLDRLLGVQEQVAYAVADAERAEADVETLLAEKTDLSCRLEVERSERLALNDQLRDEQLARVAAEARVAELKSRVARETEIADAERAAAGYANTRGLRRERETAIATASMSRRARRKFQRAIALETSR